MGGRADVKIPSFVTRDDKKQEIKNFCAKLKKKKTFLNLEFKKKIFFFINMKRKYI